MNAGPKRIFDIIDFQIRHYPNSHAFNQKLGNTWKNYSIEEARSIIDLISQYLLNKSFTKAEKGIICSTYGCPQWHFFDLAMMQIGMVSVPVYHLTTGNDLEIILDEVKPSLCIMSHPDHNRSLFELAGCEIISFEESTEAIFWESIIPSTSFKTEQQLSLVKSSIIPEELATIIYTSGSTGQPKGVMLSHQNIISNIRSFHPLNPVNKRSVVISYLPLHHIFERSFCYSHILTGSAIYYLENSEELMKYCKMLRPHFITAVPRVLEKIYDAIIKNIKSKNIIAQKVLKWAIVTGEKCGTQRSKNPWQWLKLQIADILLYRNWRKQLGGRIMGIGVGAAAMQENIARLFNAAGIKIREGYGLTETSPIVTFNRFEAGGYRAGTVGLPLPGVELRIHQPNEEGEGEILVKGPNVMMGYYNNEQLTNQVIDDNGWFHTGDVGKFVEKHFLVVTDRIKNIFKTSSGRYVYPNRIEKKLRDNEFIRDAIVIGFHRPYVVALIVPSFDNLQQWCKENGIHWTSPMYMVLNPKVIQHYNEIINGVNEGLITHEKVRINCILKDSWSIDSGEYTPTLKLKREVLLKRYHKQIEELYSN